MTLPNAVLTDTEDVDVWKIWNSLNQRQRQALAKWLCMTHPDWLCSCMRSLGKGKLKECKQHD